MSTPISNQSVHEILTGQFTDRYLKKDERMDKLAYSLPYDPSNPLCDYGRTWWEANPKWRRGLAAANTILGRLQAGLSPDELDASCVRPFAAGAQQLIRALGEYPVLLVNGHHPDLQAGITAYAAGRAIAAEGPNSFRRELLEMFRLTHVVGTRAFAPIIIKAPHLPLRIPLVSMAQWVMNPHLSFPNNKKMRAALPASFRGMYNDRFEEDVLAAIGAANPRSAGYHTLWSMSPGGTPDEPGHLLDGREVMVTAPVRNGTKQLVRKMGVGLLPVYTTFGRSKRPTKVELGSLVPPSDVYPHTLPDMMADLASFRRANGEPDVYYAHESNVAHSE